MSGLEQLLLSFITTHTNLSFIYPQPLPAGPLVWIIGEQRWTWIPPERLSAPSTLRGCSLASLQNRPWAGRDPPAWPDLLLTPCWSGRHKKKVRRNVRTCFFSTDFIESKFRKWQTVSHHLNLLFSKKCTALTNSPYFFSQWLPGTNIQNLIV